MVVVVVCSAKCGAATVWGKTWGVCSSLGLRLDFSSPSLVSPNTLKWESWADCDLSSAGDDWPCKNGRRQDNSIEYSDSCEWEGESRGLQLTACNSTSVPGKHERKVCLSTIWHISSSISLSFSSTLVLESISASAVVAAVLAASSCLVCCSIWFFSPTSISISVRYSVIMISRTSIFRNKSDFSSLNMLHLLVYLAPDLQHQQDLGMQQQALYL
ncbi:hypothetical protein E2C01_001579 [Portunus trituberculatus]|uniref:Uncharacterized protein n=1 Tax=Portunus trituberculatus TaxID=210409 RepID=A0A5B7CJM6_PORTR|nr:hypothetical protein [Portunus trituberculatus]